MGRIQMGEKRKIVLEELGKIIVKKVRNGESYKNLAEIAQILWSDVEEMPSAVKDFISDFAVRAGDFDTALKFLRWGGNQYANILLGGLVAGVCQGDVETIKRLWTEENQMALEMLEKDYIEKLANAWLENVK